VRTLLDVVVAKGAAVLKLLAGEDKPLLVRRDALLVLDLGLHVLDRVRRLDLERDGLAREGLHENLPAWSRLARRRWLGDISGSQMERDSPSGSSALKSWYTPKRF
jgi:hypothetical protein